MSGTTTLVEFLLARIGEDEHQAKQAWAGGHRGDRWLGEPDRDLAECRAKRKLVELFGYAESFSAGSKVGWYPATLAIRNLALPYVDHPDWREEWRP